MFDYTEKILHIWQRGGKWSLNLKEQIYMLSLERHSNITRAAKELGISQPALTTFLNHLEKDLDVKLFDPYHSARAPVHTARLRHTRSACGKTVWMITSTHSRRR